MASDPHIDDDPPVPSPRPVARGGRGRLVVAGRVALAAVGGYGMAALATALAALALPLPRAEAVSAATQASFAVMAGAVVFVFAASSLGRAAVGLGGVAILLAAGLWLAGGFSPMAPA
ncbi:iron transporter [Methylobacterium persicinum]|uniref:Iron transporter n=1 Tax=Methylobacterium persicinum TaxID=374426 RepID=A0ABU0HP12_9HYPH|nr:iron transporter [Methylobacterium persicinum]MDQ0444064.1 hypothetical protein [Methylobacterium persicinum]GJE38388.1 hypothetical protein KHHGKMAE_2460 [Methylobacterium persicinum]